ncbi:MAG: hypothetical protein MUE40_06590 [Anaerolineae bacterium]|jgi:hypothetical protein|nr:hypothetical protein [Anaerolineae bacterium]
MRYNTSPEFVGYALIKTRQREQLDLFEKWAAADQWVEIHLAHYEWWMYPIDEPSSYRLAWTVYAGDVAELKQDADYLGRYVRGVELLAAAWGWQLAAADFIAQPHPDQRWHNWPIRLYKCARSLSLFGFTGEFESLRRYAHHLMQQGKTMQWQGRDLGVLFQ